MTHEAHPIVRMDRTRHVCDECGLSYDTKRLAELCECTHGSIPGVRESYMFGRQVIDNIAAAASESRVYDELLPHAAPEPGETPNDPGFATVGEWATYTGSKPFDPVNNPAHYTAGGIETIDYIEAKLTHEEFDGYCRGQVLKYVSRAGKKDDCEQDLRKALWYLNRMLGLDNSAT